MLGLVESIVMSLKRSYICLRRNSSENRSANAMVYVIHAYTSKKSKGDRKTGLDVKASTREIHISKRVMHWLINR